MVHASLDSSGKQIVCGTNGVNVASKMQVELLHGHNLGVASTCSTAFDTESRTLGRLSDACDGLLVEVCTKSLYKSDSGGGFALAERSRIDTSDYDVVTIGAGIKKNWDVQFDKGFQTSQHLKEGGLKGNFTCPSSGL